MYILKTTQYKTPREYSNRSESKRLPVSAKIILKLMNQTKSISSWNKLEEIKRQAAQLELSERISIMICKLIILAGLDKLNKESIKIKIKISKV